MNWTFLAIGALLPLTWALGATLLGGAVWAVHLHRGGGSSRVALKRYLRASGLMFVLALTLASAWESRVVLRGLGGVVLGHPVDLRALGLLRLHGDGFLRADPPAALAWFRQAAERGDAPAQYYLARALASARGATRNPEEALHWAESSAQQGFLDAMLLAGDLWRPRDVDQANTWYLRTVEGLQPGLRRRDPAACLAFGSLVYAGKGLPKDPVEGLAWMEVAEQRGLPGLQTLTVQLTRSQVSVEQRDAAARRARTLLSPP